MCLRSKQKSKSKQKKLKNKKIKIEIKKKYIFFIGKKIIKIYISIMRKWRWERTKPVAKQRKCHTHWNNENVNDSSRYWHQQVPSNFILLLWLFLYILVTHLLFCEIIEFSSAINYPPLADAIRIYLALKMIEFAIQIQRKQTIKNNNINNYNNNNN